MTISPKPFSSGFAPHPFGDWRSISNFLQAFWNAFTQVRSGKLSCALEITLDNNAAFTVIQSPLLTMQSVLIFNALTTDAITLLNGGILTAEADRDNQTWTLRHINLGGVGVPSFLIGVIG